MSLLNASHCYTSQPIILHITENVKVNCYKIMGKCLMEEHPCDASLQTVQVPSLCTSKTTALG